MRSQVTKVLLYTQYTLVPRSATPAMPENYSLWPELEPAPQAAKRAPRQRGSASASPAIVEPPSAAPPASAAPDPLFCAWGGLTPWQRDYGTGRAACLRCPRRTAEAQDFASPCVLGAREVAPDIPQDVVPRGFPGLIKVPGGGW